MSLGTEAKTEFEIDLLLERDRIRQEAQKNNAEKYKTLAEWCEMRKD